MSNKEIIERARQLNIIRSNFTFEESPPIGTSFKQKEIMRQRAIDEYCELNPDQKKELEAILKNRKLEVLGGSFSLFSHSDGVVYMNKIVDSFIGGSKAINSISYQGADFLSNGRVYFQFDETALHEAGHVEFYQMQYPKFIALANTASHDETLDERTRKFFSQEGIEFYGENLQERAADCFAYLAKVKLGLVSREEVEDGSCLGRMITRRMHERDFTHQTASSLGLLRGMRYDEI